MKECISVLIPMFNRGIFIEKSLNSILNQTHTNLDIIIYDDGSRDNSVNIVKKMMKNDSRIRLIEGGLNKGVGYARNKLLDACNTKYAIFHDSDDFSNHNRVKIQYNAMIQNPMSMVYGSWENLKKIEQSFGWLDKVVDFFNPSVGFASLFFEVDKSIMFDDTIMFGGEDRKWQDEMHLKYTNEIVIKKMLYYINFHNDRIGTNKRKIDKAWGGCYDLKDLNGLSYEECINKYKKEH